MLLGVLLSNVCLHHHLSALSVSLVCCVTVCFEQTSSSTLTPATRLMVFCVLRLHLAQEGVSQGPSVNAEGASPHSVNYLDM